MRIKKGQSHRRAGKHTSGTETEAPDHVLPPEKESQTEDIHETGCSLYGVHGQIAGKTVKVVQKGHRKDPHSHSDGQRVISLLAKEQGSQKYRSDVKEKFKAF